MRIKTSLLALVLSLSTLPALADSDSAQLARFERPLQRLEELLNFPKATPLRLRALVDSDTRLQLFRLEALFRIYDDRYGDDFEQSKREVKALEDELGQYAFAVQSFEFAQKNGVSAVKIAQLKRTLSTAERNFARFLEASGWVGSRATALERIRDRIQRNVWDGNRADREYVLGKIARQLERVEKTRYDMNQLEDGIHELRRQIRWFTLEAEAVNGLIELDDRSCPSATYRPLLKDTKLASSKYARFSPTVLEPKACKIPKCLFFGALEAVREFGNLKDEGQNALAVGAAEDEAIFERASELYTAMKRGRLIERLRNSIESCI